MKPSNLCPDHYAAELIFLVRSEKNYDDVFKHLYAVSLNELTTMSDERKKAFWINIYNAFNIILLKIFPGQLADRSFRKNHFRRNEISIAGVKFSLDEIEHGILRRSKIKWAFGLINNPFATTLEKKLRLKKMDFRIHFALNCGGLSCPPIRNYDSEKIDEQLELAEDAFFYPNEPSSSDSAIVYLSKIIKWYWFDFGGKKGVLKLIRKHKLSTAENPVIKFYSYQW